MSKSKDEAYEKAYDELEKKDFDKIAMAKAIEASKGDEGLVQSNYIKFRVQELTKPQPNKTKPTSKRVYKSKDTKKNTNPWKNNPNPTSRVVNTQKEKIENCIFVDENGLRASSKHIENYITGNAILSCLTSVAFAGVFLFIFSVAFDNDFPFNIIPLGLGFINYAYYEHKAKQHKWILYHIDQWVILVKLTVSTLTLAFMLLALDALTLSYNENPEKAFKAFVFVFVIYLGIWISSLESIDDDSKHENIVLINNGWGTKNCIIRKNYTYYILFGTLAWAIFLSDFL